MDSIEIMDMVEGHLSAEGLDIPDDAHWLLAEAAELIAEANPV